MILDENLFEEQELPKRDLEKLKKEYHRRFTTYKDRDGNVWAKDGGEMTGPDGETHIAMRDDRGVQWFPKKEVDEMSVTYPKSLSEGKNLDDIVYDKLSRVRLSKGKDGKPRHPEVYANPKGNGFKLELDDEVGIDQVAKIAKEYGLNHNVKKVRDYIEVTVDTPERKAFTEAYSKSSLEQEIRNKVRDTFPNFADDEYAEYIGDYLVVEIVPQDGRTKVEVRADLTYKMMDKIADNLNPIVQKLDKDAYFDHEDTGIINAFINSKDLKESAHKTKLAEWVSNFRKKSLTESTVDYSDEKYLYKPYWYFTTHGVMPGSVPKYVQILGVVDADNGSYFATDKVIYTKDLREYEIIEKAPELDIIPEKVRINIQNWIENPIEESLMQDIQADHAWVKNEFGQEVYDALEEYISQGNDLGKVLYSEDGWDAFEEFCKNKGIEVVSKSKPFISQLTESAEDCVNAMREQDPLIMNLAMGFAKGNSHILNQVSNGEKTIEQVIEEVSAQSNFLTPEMWDTVIRCAMFCDRDKSVNESFEDEHLGTAESTPEPGPEAGIASLINKLIVDEWEAIQGYNDAIVAAETEGYSDIANVLRDIANEENLHVGQLEQVMQQLSPNAESINQGEIEAEGQLEPSTIIESVEHDFSDITNMSDAREILKKYGIDLIKEDDRNYILKKGDKKYTMYILDNPNEVRKDLERAVNKLM